MNWSRFLKISISLILISCSVKQKEIENRPLASASLIEVSELLEDQGRYKLIDFRTEEQFAKGHIDGAVNITRKMIEHPGYVYRGMMAGQEQIEELMSANGISNDDSIVVYDDNAECDASRLWFVLKYYGHNHVKLLNGGLSAWQRRAGALTTTLVRPVRTQYTISSANSPVKIVNQAEVIQVLGDPNVILLDVRSREEFAGVDHKFGALKPGRLIHSVHLDWINCVNYSGDKKFKRAEELINLFEGVDVQKEQKIIVYCHSGVRSSLTYFVLTELLGYQNVYNYDGSWVEWSHHDLPYEADSV